MFCNFLVKYLHTYFGLLVLVSWTLASLPVVIPSDLHKSWNRRWLCSLSPSVSSTVLAPSKTINNCWMNLLLSVSHENKHFFGSSWTVALMNQWFLIVEAWVPSSRVFCWVLLIVRIYCQCPQWKSSLPCWLHQHMAVCLRRAFSEWMALVPLNAGQPWVVGQGSDVLGVIGTALILSRREPSE